MDKPVERYPQAYLKLLEETQTIDRKSKERRSKKKRNTRGKSEYVPSNLPIWPICKLARPVCQLADWSADLSIALHNLPIIQESV